MKKNIKDNKKVSFNRKIIFSFFTFLIPVLFFVILEIVLRLFNFGSQYNLVIAEQKNGKKEYSLNRQVGVRYFSKFSTLVPELMPESFSFEKSPNTFRIFCLGGSTMASFPFEQNARLHFQLKKKLSILYPEINFEVINVAMSAVNSFTVLDFARELVNYKPDLFLIYTGHNEFYGAMGIGSVQSIGKNRQIIHTYLKLMRFKVVQLLKTVIDQIRGIFQKPYPETHPDQTLMEMIVNEQVISLNSKDFTIASENFRKNLIDIINISRKHKIKILISSLVSNLNSIAPFQSNFSEDFPKEKQLKWKSKFSLGMKALQTEDYFEAYKHFIELEKLKQNSAKLSYYLGKSLEGLCQFEKAREKYKRACDLDGLRFRAPTVFNEIIHQTGSSLEVPIVEMEEVFAQNSTNGIMGDQFFFEHVHPDFDGYNLMIENFYDAIISNNLINFPATNQSKSSNKMPTDFANFSYITDFDREIGNIKISRLLKRWPFRSDQFDHSLINSELDSLIQGFVFPYLARQISWEDARYRLAEYYENNGNLDKAMKEYDILSLVSPDNYYPHFKKANIYFLSNQLLRVEESLNEVIKRNNQSAAVFSKKGVLKFMQKKYDDAQVNFKKAIEINKSSKELSNSGVAMANYYLALTYIKFGVKENALSALKETLHYQPNNYDAQNLLNLLRSDKELKLTF